jgi:FAD/FMN-containing dehydrogenase
MSLADGLSFLKKEQIVTDASILESHGRDWTRVHKPSPSAILFPQTKMEIQRIVQWARKTKTFLVPSGGRTGLSGGAVAVKSEVVISLDRMNKILDCNEIDRVIRCEAGVVTETLQNYIADKGFYFPIDFASRGSSQIGGNISTNAGGTKVIRFGLTRQWVAGLEVVTGTGDLLSMSSGLIKNNAGYDLSQIFIGSEGTLGIIAEATLRFTQPLQNLKVLLVSSPKLEAALEILKRFQKYLSITAFEFFTEAALQKVLSQKGGSSPFQEVQPFYFVIEFECLTDEALNDAIDIFELCKKDGIAYDGLLAQNDRQAKEFWGLRENISECLAPSRPYKNDISVRVSKIPEFVSEASKLFSSKFKDCEIIWFGHIGDGNLHINILRGKNQTEADFAKMSDAISQDLGALLKKFDGSISAEHGIGLLKKPYLSLSRSAEEISAMKALKRAFDPDGILNPGKIFDS